MTIALVRYPDGRFQSKCVVEFFSCCQIDLNYNLRLVKGLLSVTISTNLLGSPKMYQDVRCPVEEKEIGRGGPSNSIWILFNLTPLIRRERFQVL